MRIAFLYNAQDHHLLHSLPIACELLRVSPEHEVVLLQSSAVDGLGIGCAAGRIGGAGPR